MANQRKSQVFISYSRKNKAFVRKLNSAIDASGFDAWVDWEGIPLTADWMATITSAIEASDTLLFVISDASLDSEYCQKELEIAITGNKKIVPVVYAEPGGKKKIHPKLSATNWVFMRPKKDNFKLVIPKLIEAISTDLDWVQQHTDLLQRATQWKQKNKSNGYLLQGSSLEEAERWMADSTQDEKRAVTPLQAEYLQACRKYAIRRQRGYTLAFGLLTVISFVFLFLSIRQSIESKTLMESAQRSAEIAQEQTNLAYAAENRAKTSEENALKSAEAAKAQRSAAQALAYSTRPGELGTSTLLALESLTRSQSAEAEDVLRSNFSRMPIPVAHAEHLEWIWDMNVSPDGQYIATASLDDSACVWTMLGEKKFCVKHEDDVTDAIITHDNLTLITSSKDGTVRFWNMETGEQVEAYQYNSSVLDIDLSPDNTLLLVGREDGFVSVINLPKHRDFFKYDFSAGPIAIVRFHPDGEWATIAPRVGTIRIWKVLTGSVETGPKHNLEIFNVVTSPDGKIMVSVSEDSTARVARAETGRITHVIQHPDWVEDVAFSPDNSWFVTVSDDKIVRVFDAESAVELLRMSHGDFVEFVEVSPNGEWIASTGYDRTARVWDAHSGALMLEASLDGNGSALLFSPDGNRLIVGDEDGNLTIWDISSLNKRTSYIEFSEFINKAKFDPSGQWLLVNTDDKNVWQIPVSSLNAAHDESIGTVLLSFDEISSQMIVSMNSKWVAVSIDSEENNSRIVLRNLETGVSYELPVQSHISSLAFNSDGTRLASSHENSKDVIVWDVETGQQLDILPFDAPVYSLAYSPKGPIMAVGMTNQIILWDSAQNKELATLGQVGNILSMSFSLDGNWLATAGLEGNIYIWDMTGENFSAPKVQFHQNSRITSLDFHPSNTWLASGSADGYVYLWDFTTGQEVTRLQHNDKVTGVNFSPDGNLLSTVSRKTVQFWNIGQIVPVMRENLAELACARLYKNLSFEQWESFFPDEEYHPLCPDLP